jgi:hypothetical protein
MMSTSRHILLFLITFLGAYVQYRADCNIERIRSEKHHALKVKLIGQHYCYDNVIVKGCEKKVNIIPHTMLPAILPGANQRPDTASVSSVIFSYQRTIIQSAL